MVPLSPQSIILTKWNSPYLGRFRVTFTANGECQIHGRNFSKIIENVHLKQSKTTFLDKTNVKLLILGVEVMSSLTQVKGKRFYIVQIHACRKGDSKSLSSPL